MDSLDRVIMNLALLVSLAYLWSLFIHHPRQKQQSAFHQWAETLMAAFVALTLLKYPLLLAGGYLADLRLVPIAVVGLRYTPLHALLAALPVAFYRYTLGGTGTIPALLTLTVMLALLTIIHGWARLHRTRILRYRGSVWLVMLSLLAPLPLLPDVMLVTQILPVTYVLHVSMAFVLLAMLKGKQRQLLTVQEASILSFTDPLTALSNRRKWELDSLELPPNNHLLVLDIDHFKRINDQHGHHVGDEVLQTLALVIRESLGHHQAYRLGGEEFLVVLTGVNHRRAIQWAELLREAFSERVELLHPHLPVPVTFSGGLVAKLPAESPQEALMRADQLLYRAKNGGRNCIVHLLKTHRTPV